MKEKKINYVYGEDKIINEIFTYIKSTYNQHYAGNDQIQTTQFIMSNCQNYEFLTGCAIKYLARFGKKEGYNRKDVLKAIHFCVMILHYLDKKHGDPYVYEYSGLSNNTKGGVAGLPNTTEITETISNIMGSTTDVKYEGLDEKFKEVLDLLPEAVDEFTEENDPLIIKAKDVDILDILGETGKKLTKKKGIIIGN